MTDPIPVRVIKYYPNTLWRRVLGFFVPRLGPTKYGTVSITPDGSTQISHDGALYCERAVDYGELAEWINSATDWDQSIIKLPEPEDD